MAGSRTGRSANQQKIGDYFASCMDETAIEQRDLTPLAPTFAAIEAMKSLEDLPALLARLQLDSGGDGFLFGFSSAQDFVDAQAVIAFATAGGLGMPDRDYYTDGDKRARALRQNYRKHVARTFVLLGDSAAAASRHSDTVLRLETQLARASFTRVELRDPYNLFHKMDRAGLERLTPHFAWDPFLTTLGLSAVDTFNVTQPKFYAALDQLLGSTGLDDLKTYLRWQAVHAASPFLARRFEDERFSFFDYTLRGVPQQKPRWKRCVQQVDALLGEALGQEFVRAPSVRS